MEMARRIDHTLLRPEASAAEIDQLIQEARTHGFASVCVHGRWVERVAAGLIGSPVKTCAVAGFPLGAGPVPSVAAEAAELVRLGAQEIDFVAHLPLLLACDAAAAREDFRQVVEAARAESEAVIVKVILETACLLQGIEEDDPTGDRRIVAACTAALEAGCDFVKTSTGFHPAGGATERAVRLMKQHSGGLLVKASGGIRSRSDANRMVAAGADRLGCSAGVAIVAGGEVASARY